MGATSKIKIRRILTQFCYSLAIWLLFCGMVAWGIGTGKHVDTPELRMPVHELSIPELVIRAALNEGLPSHVAITQCWIESNCTNPPRPSRTLDFGPMQVHGPTWVAYGLDPALLLDYRVTTFKGVEWLAVHWRRCPATANRAYIRGRCR